MSFVWTYKYLLIAIFILLVDGGPTKLKENPKQDPSQLRSGPTLDITPHETSIDVGFTLSMLFGGWNSATDYSLTIHEGTDVNGDVLCESPFNCTTDQPTLSYCSISSNDYCEALPPCSDMFVVVSGEGEVSDESTKTTGTNVKSHLQYGDIHLSWTPLDDWDCLNDRLGAKSDGGEIYRIEWNNNTITTDAGETEYVIAEDDYDESKDEISIYVCPTDDYATCSDGPSIIKQVIIHPVENLKAKIDRKTLSVTWSCPGDDTTTLSSTTESVTGDETTDKTETSVTDIHTEDTTVVTDIPPGYETETTFMVFWNDNNDTTSTMTWETDLFEFDDDVNRTVQVCVSAEKGGESSRKICTDAVDGGDDDPDLALIIGLSIGIPVALCIIGLIVYKVIKGRSSSNRRESDISIPTRRPNGQDNPEKTNEVLISEFSKLKSLPSDRNSNIARRYKDKNPYTDVLPYDDTLVKLKGVEYMNASYILDKKFIVSPDPMPDQDNDIWQLIYECNIRVIVRISAGGEQKPMAQYIPDHAGDSWVMGADEVDINLQSSQQWDGYAENTLKLKKNGDSRELKHFHLTNWPEGSAQNQKDQAKVLRLISSGRNFLKKAGNGETPILIHCGAGSGRAGTLTGIWQLMDQHDNREQVNTYRCVEAMRKDRVGMVQNQEQYNFMYNCIMEYQKQSHIYRGSENEYGEYEQ